MISLDQDPDGPVLWRLQLHDHGREQACAHGLQVPIIPRYGVSKILLDARINAGVYILQNTMVVGGMAVGEKN